MLTWSLQILRLKPTTWSLGRGFYQWHGLELWAHGDNKMQTDCQSVLLLFLYSLQTIHPLTASTAPNAIPRQNRSSMRSEDPPDCHSHHCIPAPSRAWHNVDAISVQWREEGSNSGVDVAVQDTSMQLYPPQLCLAPKQQSADWHSPQRHPQWRDRTIRIR